MNFLIQQIKKHLPHRECILIGFLFSLFLVFGREISLYGQCNYSLRSWIMRTACILGISLPFAFALELCFQLLEKVGRHHFSNPDRKEHRFSAPLYRHPFYSALALCFLLLLCWLPIFFAFYPGIYAYDTPNQTWQFYASEYNTHHPLIHTLFMRLFVSWGEQHVSWNFGIALYTCAQMLLLSILLSACLYFLLKWRAPFWIFVFSTLFFALCPICSLFAVSATKDTLFAGFLLLTIFLLTELVRHPQKNMRLLFLYVLSAAFTCLFRNNGIYILVFSFPFFLLIPKGRRLRILICTLAAMGIFAGTNAALNAVLHPQKGSVAEMLSIPIQQFARVAAMHDDELTHEEYESMYVFIDEEKLPLYNPTLSDPVKDGFKEDAFFENTKLFIHTWLYFLQKYPGTYVDAFLCSSYGNWYPGYDFGGYLELSVKDMYGLIPDIHRNSKFPSLEQTYTKFFAQEQYKDIPVLSILLNPVLYIWLLFITIAWLIRRHIYSLIPPLMPLIGLWGTMLLGPIALVRYMLPILFVLPLLLYLLFAPQTASKNIRES